MSIVVVGVDEQRNLVVLRHDEVGAFRRLVPLIVMPLSSGFGADTPSHTSSSRQTRAVGRHHRRRPRGGDADAAAAPAAGRA